MNYTFNAKETTEKAAQWIRDFFEKNGKGCNAVIGISGGKDSSICAALCVKALGKERVIGVLMPNGEQSDIDMARLLVNHLDIKAVEVNINEAYKGVLNGLENAKPVNGFRMDGISNQTIVNLPPRLRMAVLYAVSQSCNGRVANTCNLSEDWVGYSTRYGDSVGDFSPLARLTVAEVKEMGRFLGLPEVLVDKVPSDGLCGKTDEDNLGFTYAVLDKYIRTGVCEDPETKAIIDDKHIKNKFKLELMPCFEFQP
ncbi:MAG: NAD(+) synthase [Ruminococcus sp.]|nr:NAD(+) synthase [Ruminococcus sp.]